MKKVHLTFITENQAQKNKAEKLAEIIRTELGEKWEILNIESYLKFENSFKIELICSIEGNDKSEINTWTISTSDKIVSPWLIYFDKIENSIELIFNKDEYSRYNNTKFNVIKWGHWQLLE